MFIAVSAFPDDKFAAKQMDSFTGQNAGENVKAFESDQIMYISKQNFARFGESSSKGEMTKNCEQSMREYGLPVPSDFPIRDIEAFFGEMAK